MRHTENRLFEKAETCGRNQPILEQDWRRQPADILKASEAEIPGVVAEPSHQESEVPSLFVSCHFKCCQSPVFEIRYLIRCDNPGIKRAVQKHESLFCWILWKISWQEASNKYIRNTN